MTASAQLVFEGQPTVVLPRLLDLARGCLRGADSTDGRVTDASLTALRFEAPGVRMDLSMSLTGARTVVTLRITLGAAPDTSLEAARLAAVTYGLVKATDASAVIWNETALPIPRAQFLDGLAANFGDAPAARAEAPVVAPRRVMRTPGRLSARGAQRGVNQSRASDRRYDAHVTAYEAHMATELRSASSAAEEDTLPRQRAGAALVMQSAELRAASLVITVSTLVLSSGGIQVI